MNRAYRKKDIEGLAMNSIPPDCIDREGNDLLLRVGIGTAELVRGYDLRETVTVVERNGHKWFLLPDAAAAFSSDGFSLGKA